MSKSSGQKQRERGVRPWSDQWELVALQTLDEAVALYGRIFGWW